VISVGQRSHEIEGMISATTLRSGVGTLHRPRNETRQSRENSLALKGFEGLVPASGTSFAKSQR